ncbi:hypothetical protein [Roseovarius aestuarii]|uniref:Uncharacterized protein n=1 Tax=Roseovarius aestuarii TaxID=475083 RepID=A0A1X7BWJ1_9RHOB|nr:hypothetical protein [Roseovarius aestuarii]SMC14011.1 hypothetical protein ROA7745_03873 [Roseovarius aestuarii]
MADIALIDPSEARPDVFVGCVGYEHRSLQALKEMAASGYNGTSFVYDYRSGDLHSYLENLDAECLKGADLIHDFSKLLNRLADYIDNNEKASILLDITSLDREKIALLLRCIFKKSSCVGSVTICYFPRDFTEPSHSLDIVRSFGPVLPAFIGEASFSRESLALIIGAGYEYGRAVGAIDLLEPDRIYCLTPVGTDPRFEREIEKNNLDFSFLEEGELLQRYDLLKPEALFYEIRRIVEFETHERNVLILPLGPKIFAAVSLIVALILHPSVMVWRHSTATKVAPASTDDARASGVDIRLAFRFTS